MKSFLIIIICILSFSCQQKEARNNPLREKEITAKKTSTKQNKQIGDTIFMNFKNEKDVFTADGTIDSIHSRIYIKFKNEFSSQLNGNIILESGPGNIRFNQIIFPDKTADGPFGADLKINAEQKGDYILIIGHSQMAENPYWGKFKVQLETRKK